MINSTDVGIPVEDKSFQSKFPVEDQSSQFKVHVPIQVSSTQQKREETNSAEMIQTETLSLK